MINKKPIKILTGIALGATILATVILAFCVLNPGVIYSLRGLDPGYYNGLTVIPWPNVISVLSALCFAVLITVLSAKLEGKPLRIVGIILAAALLLNNLTGTVQSLVSTAIASGQGIDFLAAHSALSSTILIITGPLISIATACMYFACGMCALSRNSIER